MDDIESRSFENLVQKEKEMCSPIVYTVMVTDGVPY